MSLLFQVHHEWANQTGSPMDFTLTDLSGKDTGMLHYILFSILLCISIFYLSVPLPLYYDPSVALLCAFHHAVERAGRKWRGSNAWVLPISGSA